MSASELANFAKQIADAKKSLKDADNARWAGLLQEFAETVLTERDMEVSEKSGWTGVKTHGIPMEIDGLKVTVSVTVTDTVATEAAKVALAEAEEAEKALAAAQEAQAAALAAEEAAKVPASA